MTQTKDIFFSSLSNSLEILYVLNKIHVSNFKEEKSHTLQNLPPTLFLFAQFPVNP